MIAWRSSFGFLLVAGGDGLSVESCIRSVTMDRPAALRSRRALWRCADPLRGEAGWRHGTHHHHHHDRNQDHRADRLRATDLPYCVEQASHPLKGDGWEAIAEARPGLDAERATTTPRPPDPRWTHDPQQPLPGGQARSSKHPDQRNGCPRLLTHGDPLMWLLSRLPEGETAAEFNQNGSITFRHNRGHLRSRRALEQPGRALTHDPHRPFHRRRAAPGQRRVAPRLSRGQRTCRAAHGRPCTRGGHRGRYAQWRRARDAGQEWAGRMVYSSCGDLAAWMLYRLAVVTRGWEPHRR